MGTLFPVITPSAGLWSRRSATGSDLLAIAALGTAARHAATCQDMREAIEEIAGPLWAPTLDSLQSVIERLLERGQMRRTSDVPGLAAQHVTTHSGRERLCRLLALDTAHPSCLLAQVGTRLGMAFLDLIPQPRRRGYIESSLYHCELQVREWRRRSALCRAQGDLGRRWLAHEGQRLQQEQRLLRDMLAELP